jgi:hypothetical protein
MRANHTEMTGSRPKRTLSPAISNFQFAITQSASDQPTDWTAVCRPAGARISILSTASRRTPISSAFSMGVKLPGLEADHSAPSCAEDVINFIYNLS